MNYLENNLSNSVLLPYDVMKLIYEYADPFNAIRKQIENKEYDLDEIMYKRMKKRIKNDYTNYGREYLILSKRITDDNPIIKINSENINDRKLKDIILNYDCGYKSFYLWKSKRQTNICSLEPNFIIWYKEMMIKDLKFVNPEIIYDIKNMKQIYKLWLKL